MTLTSTEKKVISRAAIITALLGAIIIGPNCTKDQKQTSTNPRPFRVAVNSWIGWGPLFIAKEKGFFEGVEVDIKFVEDAGDRRSAMISESVDGYASGVDGLAIDALLGVRAKAVMCFDESAGADGIIAKSNVTWENLAGRDVAVQKGLPGHFLLLYIMTKHGLKPSDVHIIDMNSDKAGAALIAGTVDVAVTWEPWISKAVTSSNTKKLFTTAEQPGLIVDILVIRDRVLETRSGDVRGVVNGWFRAVDWYNNNRDEGTRIIARAYNLNVDEVGSMVSGVTFSDMTRNRELMGTSENPGPIHVLFDQASILWEKAGVTKSTLSAHTYFDMTYLNRK